MSRGLALVTHSTSPRGGMLHTMALAEALHAAGRPVHLVTQGERLHRPLAVPHTVLAPPDRTGTLSDRVFASIDALAGALEHLAGEFGVLHAQDCIAARAAARVRDAGAPVRVVRTVHHVDDFTTPALVHCQRAAIEEPDRVLVVSQQWRRILRDDYGVHADVVPNGVDAARFAPVTARRRAELRASVGAADRFLFLSVGGIEPRKGTRHAFEALARMDPRPILAVVGGHSFQDYAAYREQTLAALPSLGLELGRDVLLLGTLSEQDLGDWYGSADALVFPSVKEGWGLAVLEAMAAGLPVVASDLPVFHEYLVDGRNALLPAVADPEALAAAMTAVATDAGLRDRLSTGGAATVGRFTWERSAEVHAGIYDSLHVPA